MAQLLSLIKGSSKKHHKVDIEERAATLWWKWCKMGCHQFTYKCCRGHGKRVKQVGNRAGRGKSSSPGKRWVTHGWNLGKRFKQGMLALSSAPFLGNVCSLGDLLRNLSEQDSLENIILSQRGMKVIWHLLTTHTVLGNTHSKEGRRDLFPLGIFNCNEKQTVFNKSVGIKEKYQPSLGIASSPTRGISKTQ